jgi:alanine racemase
VVRPGVSLFGGGPEERPDARLKAVATLTAPIADVRNLRPGDILGYGDSVRIAAPTRVAVVAAGYATGSSGQAGPAATPGSPGQGAAS